METQIGTAEFIIFKVNIFRFGFSIAVNRNFIFGFPIQGIT